MRKRPHGFFVVVLVLASAGVLGGCMVHARTRPATVSYAASSEVYVSQPMPPPRVEVVQTVAPYSGAVWVRGHWQWRGGGWYWVSGRWSRPARPGTVWVGPRYVYRNGRHVYVRGHWGGRGAVRVRGSGAVQRRRAVRRRRGRRPAPPAAGVRRSPAPPSAGVR